MVRIDTYTAQRGLQGSSTPSVQLSSAVSQELQQAGGAVSDLASSFIQRQEQKENFKAENDLRKLRLDLDNELQTRALNMPEGGEGFHDTFLAEAYRPKRDEFLAGVPERLRPQFEAILADEDGAEAAAYSIKAATAERDESYRWFKQEIGATHEQLATAISMNPEAYDAYLEEGRSVIEAAVLPTAEKALLERQWESIAQVAHLNQMLADDPEGVLRELGVDTRNLSPTTQFSILSRAVQWAESSDNPNAVSGKGAVGLMQVMPATARDIAKALGDERFPTGAPDAAVAAYLTNPHVNKMYGEHYLREQLRAFGTTRNPIETALVAYNAGPSVAQKWVESGYDDSILSKETRDYKKEILASMSSPVAKGSPKDVKFIAGGGGTPFAKGGGDPLAGVSVELKDRIADAFATVGLGTVKVNSGYRSEAQNKAAGGAEQSEHLHGNAMDIDVSGMKPTDRIELIKALSAAGVTGLGIGANIIHADLGGRRAWGYATAAGGGEVPKWAAGVIAEHLKGTTPPPRAINQRYASLSYDANQKFIAQADQVITAREAAAAKATAVQTVEVRQAVDDELARVRATGVGSETFDPTSVATILGEDDYLKFTYDRDVAQRTYTAVQGIATMTEEQMQQRFDDYEPAGSDFEAKTDIHNAVAKEIERVRRLRTSSPDQAAIEFPEVQEAYRQMAANVDVNGAPGDPVAVQTFVKTMLDTQKSFGVPAKAQAPIDHGWAVRIGQSLLKIPTRDTKEIKGNDIRVGLILAYEELQKTFGDYTDEVLIYAINEYTGLDPIVANVITADMAAIAAGRDPFASTRRALDTAVDIDQSTPRTNVFGETPVLDLLFPPPEETAISPEQRRQEQEAEQE